MRERKGIQVVDPGDKSEQIESLKHDTGGWAVRWVWGWGGGSWLCIREEKKKKEYNEGKLNANGVQILPQGETKRFFSGEDPLPTVGEGLPLGGWG